MTASREDLCLLREVHRELTELAAIVAARLDAIDRQSCTQIETQPHEVSSDAQPDPIERNG